MMIGYQFVKEPGPSVSIGRYVEVRSLEDIYGVVRGVGKTNQGFVSIRSQLT
jgi:hypothetical protein